MGREGELHENGGFHMTIGEKIRMYRKEAGLSQRELGIACGKSQYEIAQYETGSRNPKPDTVKLLASALGVSYTPQKLGSTENSLLMKHLNTAALIAESIHTTEIWDGCPQNIRNGIEAMIYDLIIQLDLAKAVFEGWDA